MINHQDIALAHQYLYYVSSSPIWSDHEYDQFCKRHGIDGSGGSDLEDQYPKHVKAIAQHMLSKPSLYPPSM